MEKIKETKNWFFIKINKINKLELEKYMYFKKM